MKQLRKAGGTKVRTGQSLRTNAEGAIWGTGDISGATMLLDAEGMKVPHPIPYQGSKRNLAIQILAYFPDHIDNLIEPFAGSGAITLAAAVRGLAEGYHLNDLNAPLIELWRMIIEEPQKLAKQYERIWRDQHDDRREYYSRIRNEFNQTRRPHHFLYLLARCVKASVRYNSKGEFNQSPDKRRMGALPTTMCDHILGASHLLNGKTKCTSEDYKSLVKRAQPEDFIYMDPPYQGVCGDRDPRYLKGVLFDEFVEALCDLNARDISYIVSYDGRTGDKVHGRTLPPSLQLRHIELAAGRSSQETLLGRSAVTYESLYLSPALEKRLQTCRRNTKPTDGQLVLLEAGN
ncbi:MAG: DNA adenine methylase [Elusimicrobia bacterium]|nr:DNA adenine methylase [Elusimicrobiota bacterium]